MANLPRLGLFDTKNGLVQVVADNFDTEISWAEINSWIGNDCDSVQAVPTLVSLARQQISLEIAAVEDCY